MVILDSTVLIDLINNKQTAEVEWLTTNAFQQEFAITDLILCETLQGLRNSEQFEKVRVKLDDLICFDAGGKRLAILAASNYSFLRQQGITVRKTIDCLIATFCIEHGHQLLHHDRDFDHFEQHLGLKVLKP